MQKICSYVLAKGKPLPVYLSQKLNAYLKEITDLCGIQKPLTFHIARHTFATTETLINGMPIETVSKFLGHAIIKTIQIYAKVVEQKVSQEMNTLRGVLTNQNDKKVHV
jgi:site-specific recombinase XerD